MDFPANFVVKASNGASRQNGAEKLSHEDDEGRKRTVRLDDLSLGFDEHVPRSELQPTDQGRQVQVRCDLGLG